MDELAAAGFAFRHPRSTPLNSPTHQTRILESGKMGGMGEMEENVGNGVND